MTVTGRGEAGRRARPVHRAVLAAACALALSGGIAADPVGREAGIVGGLLRGSGVDRDLAAIAPLANSWLDAIGSRDALRGPQVAGAADPPPADRLALRAIVARGFDAATLRRDVHAALRRRLDVAKAEAALAWLERPEVLALHRAGREGAACEPAGAPRDAVRAAAAVRVAAATSAARRSRRSASRIYAALLRAGNALLPETRRFTRVQLAEMIALHDAHLRAAADARHPACRYRAFPTAQLVSAQRFLESEAGRWLERALSRAAREALDRAAAATALRIVEAFGAPRATPLRVASALRGAPLRGAGRPRP